MGPGGGVRGCGQEAMRTYLEKSLANSSSAATPLPLESGPKDRD